MLIVLGQFWQLLKYCNSGPGKIMGWFLLAVVFTLDLGTILTSLWMIKWTADFYNALEQHNVSTAITQVGVFGLIVLVNTGLALTSQYLQGVLQIRWRERLTEITIDAWMANKAYWHLNIAKEGKKPDNPDQRIAEDCEIFVKYTLAEGLELITNIIALFSYVTVLWGLSAYILHFNILGFDITITRYMVWVAFIYVFVSSFMAHLFGRRLKATYVEQQKKEADFRFAMAHMRQNASDIAVMNGEAYEKQILTDRFSSVRENWFRLVARQVQLGLFTYPYRHSIFRISTFFGLPGYFAGALTFGGLMQLGQSFTQVTTNLSWFIFNYHKLAELVSAISRLSGFLHAAKSVARADGIHIARSAMPSLQLRDVVLQTPDKQTLLTIPNLEIKAGKTIWLRGHSGLGKTTLLRLIAGAWNFASGTIYHPDASMLVLSQKPYIPNTGLHDAACYPASPQEFEEAEIADALAKVGLTHLLIQKNLEAGRLSSTLSGGEMQRLALARAIVNKPDWLFLDEATSALDKKSEIELLDLLRQELPNATIVILAHRTPGNLSIDSVVDLEAFGATDKPSDTPVLQTA